MLKYILIGSFIIACIFQGITLIRFNIADGSMWANQAQYVQTGDARQFNAAFAYGHPGGPIIEGTILLHSALGISYNKALIAFLVFFNSLIIAGVCALCFILKKDNLWWLVALGILSLNTMYDVATPPSAVVSLLIVFLCLLTLYLYENKARVKPPALIFWCLVAGLTVATRADIGIISALVFAALLRQAIGWKKIFIMLFGILLAFIIFDPFMWFMPIRHIGDLVSKAVYHYAEFVPNRMTFFAILKMSLLAFVSMFLSIFFVFSKKKISSPLSPAFILGILAMTAGLYAVFLTANYQAPRYFMPLIFIWELFFPLFIFSLIPQINLNFLATAQSRIQAQKVIKIFIAILLIGYPAYFLLVSL